MTLQETTRSQIRYFVKIVLLLLMNVIFYVYISLYFLMKILGKIDIFKLNDTLLKYNNY